MADQPTVKKEIYRASNVIGNIDAIKFQMMDSPVTSQMAHMEIESHTMYIPEGQPSAGKVHPLGPLSEQLGTSQKEEKCKNCFLTVDKCPGHFGYIQLHRPVFHVGFFDKVKTILQCICKTCSRLLMDEEKISSYQLKAIRARSKILLKKPMLREIADQCKKVRICPHCGEINGTIKKEPTFKLVHEKFRNTKADDAAKEVYRSLHDNLIKHDSRMAACIPKKAVQVLYPSDVLQLFKNMNAKDIVALCMDSQSTQPCDLLITRVAVAPNCVRPSVQDAINNQSREDDLTGVLSSIVMVNKLIANVCDTRSVEQVLRTHDTLQVLVNLMINADTPVPPEIDLKKERKPRVGLMNRLKGKSGRFRNNLSGKRVDYSGRTVISPDPNLKIDQVGVPIDIALRLTYPERVTEHNIELMKQLIMNGPQKHPGAMYITEKIKPDLVKSIRYRKQDREPLVQNLRVGDIVGRHLMDGDIVLFNRQPSLHKMSIMAHRAITLPWKTLRFNECVCNPYNADFDGDEMNLHLPQTEEARAEALQLMGVPNNLVTPQSGNLIIGATQDFLTGSFLLTSMDMFFDKSGATTIIMSIAVPGVGLDLPPPAILVPMKLWTGKQLFSLIMRMNKDEPVKCNLEVKKCSSPKCNHDFELCHDENHVMIQNSELLAGVMDKSLLGAGGKKNVFYTILKDYGKKYAAESMWRVGRMATRFLMMYGFTIGIGDLTPSSNLNKMKEARLDIGYDNCKQFIEDLKSGHMESAPGCNPEETLEQKMLSTLSNIREEAGKECLRELRGSNTPLIMAKCGSKGSVINISQMIACVGQQAIGGKRVPDGFSNRSLPYFKLNAKDPEAKGFVSNSFFSGLSPSEFMFHTMGGREGLVDTAVKTAETGYMQRRLMKCIEDLHIAYDNTVRNGHQDLIQYKYGDDGLDPTHIETTSYSSDIQPPLEFGRILQHTKKAFVQGSEDVYLNSKEVEDITRKYLNEICQQENFGELSETFRNSIIKFMDELAQEIKSMEDVIEVVKRKQEVKLEKEYKEGTLKSANGESVDSEEKLQELVKEQCDNLEKGYRQIRHLKFNQVIKFIDTVIRRYYGTKSKDEANETGTPLIIEPGTAVGALCAQSIGEPATQMTLKTFHFAGVAAMNITLGVPRIKEIINATKNISTPIITAQLRVNTDDSNAREVKSRIEKTLLGDVCESIVMVINGHGMFYIVKLATNNINLLKLKVSAESVKYSILNSKMKLLEHNIRVINPRILTVKPTLSGKDDPWFQMDTIAKDLPKVIVMGLPTVSRVVIHHKGLVDGRAAYELLVEGNNLLEVIATYGIIGTKCSSNNVMEVKTVLGIEASRSTIINEIKNTMKSHGLKVDWRHFTLLADHMTCKGSVHGITRHGLAKVKESILTLASFEKTDEHLFDAAYHGQINQICGVSDCIVTGKPVNVGTGVFKLMQQHKRKDNIKEIYKLTEEQEAAMNASVANSKIYSKEPEARPGIFTRRPLLFDLDEYHKPLP